MNPPNVIHVTNSNSQHQRLLGICRLGRQIKFELAALRIFYIKSPSLIIIIKFQNFSFYQLLYIDTEM